jgi:hypothetical protein
MLKKNLPKNCDQTTSIPGADDVLQKPEQYVGGSGQEGAVEEEVA